MYEENNELFNQNFSFNWAYETIQESLFWRLKDDRPSSADGRKPWNDLE